MLEEDLYKSGELPGLSSPSTSGRVTSVAPSRGASSSSHDPVLSRPLQYSVEALLAKNDPRIGEGYFILTIVVEFMLLENESQTPPPS